MKLLSRFKTSFVVAIALAVLASFAPPVAAQTTAFDYQTATLIYGKNASDLHTAVGTSKALLIRYIGPQPSGTVDVSAAGLLTFKHGTIGAEVVDTSIECDNSIAVTGSRNGIWDVSASNCNTIGEGAGVLNGQVTAAGRRNWAIIPLAAFATDDLSCGGSGCLTTVTGSSASTLDGLALNWDTAVTFTDTLACVPVAAQKISYYLKGTMPDKTSIIPNPFIKTKTILSQVKATSTYGSGTSTFRITAVLPSYTMGTDFTETVAVLYPDTAGGATTVEKVFVALNDGSRISSDNGWKIVARLTNSAALTAPLTFCGGTLYPTDIQTSR